MTPEATGGYVSAELGARLRRAREAAGLTQEALAERSGLGVRTISDLERGRTRPRPSTVRQLLSVLELPAPRGPVVTAPARAQLPADIADFTGRDGQVKQLVSALAQPEDRTSAGRVPICLIAGTGGIGKSALAVHTAHQISAQFPDGQLYLNLRGSGARPVQPREALARLARDLGADKATVLVDEDECAARYRGLAAGMRLLIVLDDARDAAQVRPLVPGVAGCAVLITSRHRMPDLAGAQLIDLDLLGEDEAAELFSTIVEPARVAAEPEAAKSVLAACGGLPLAVRIAAARLVVRPGWPIAALAGRLADARSWLAELQAGDLAVRASLLVSYESVRPADAGEAAPDRVFRLLGLTEGPDIALPAAAELLGLPAAEAERSLELLVDCHLLQCASPGRYCLHDLPRAFALEQALAEESEASRSAALRRMLTWYVRTATAAAIAIRPGAKNAQLEPAELEEPSLRFDSGDDAAAWCEAELANLVSAVRQAASLAEHELAWDLAWYLTAPFDLRGNTAAWIETQQIALACARRLGDSGRLELTLNNLGAAYIHARQMGLAIDCLTECLPLAAERDDQGVALAKANLGYALAESGRVDEALPLLTESLRFYQGAGNLAGEGLAWAVLAKVYRRIDRFDEAVGYCERALDALSKANDRVNIGATLLQLAPAQLGRGRPAEAIDAAEAALELYRQLGSQFGRARALAELGRARRELGQLDQVRALWTEAFSILTDLGHPQAAEVAADLAAIGHAPLAGVSAS